MTVVKGLINGDVERYVTEMYCLIDLYFYFVFVINFEMTIIELISNCSAVMGCMFSSAQDIRKPEESVICFRCSSLIT